MYKKYEALKKEYGVTDYKVSEEAEITRSTFSDWKSGRSAPKLDKLQKLAKYFNVPLEYFIEDDK